MQYAERCNHADIFRIIESLTSYLPFILKVVIKVSFRINLQWDIETLFWFSVWQSISFSFSFKFHKFFLFFSLWEPWGKIPIPLQNLFNQFSFLPPIFLLCGILLVEFYLFHWPNSPPNSFRAQKSKKLISSSWFVFSFRFLSSVRLSEMFYYHMHFKSCNISVSRNRMW